MANILIYFLIAFALALILSPLILLLLRKLKTGQTILHYVEMHKKKSGTPTMGGFIFILPLVILSLFVLHFKKTPLSNIIVLASVGYALIGFLDDFIKIKGKQNLGLKAYQKIIGQGGIAVLVSIFYFMYNPDGMIWIPFINQFVNIGWGILPLCFFVMIATTNSVNLTDGLDGLASSVSLFYFVFIGIIIALLSRMTNINESETFMKLIAITCGGLVCFLLFNSNKASVFMGDTGSLYLGSLVALISMFSFGTFYILIIGIMFVLSSVSDILQVAYFKATKRKTGQGKRIFLMAPFHHHMEKKGFAEAKIVFIYSAVTILAGVICITTMI